MKLHYIIYQLPVNNRHAYLDFQDGASFYDYVPVWEDDIEAEDEWQACEDLYRQFNTHKPKNYAGHSLSVSDIIILEDSDRVFYCSSVAWTELRFENDLMYRKEN